MRLLIIFSILLTLSSCRNDKQSTETSDKKIDSAMWKIIDKYNISYQRTINESRDTINILKRFPLVKTISFPEGINVEFRTHYDCHEHIELLIFYDSSTVSIIPFYGTFYYNKHLKNDSNKYVTAFAVELNKTFRTMNDFIEQNKRYIKYQNSIFLYRSSFVNFIMNELYFFRPERIRDMCVLDEYKQNIEELDFNLWKIPYSKKQAIDNIEKLKINDNVGLYGIFHSMILKFEYPTDSLEKDSIKVDAINNETFIEWIW